MLACGALAQDIVDLQAQIGQAYDLQCLPAGYHNRPNMIVPELKKLLDKSGPDYDTVIIGYGDCGTGGGLDRLLEDYPNAHRLEGAHCYAFFAGLEAFDDMMEEEIGSFFLTDYLTRHFDTLIMKGMGLDKKPELRDLYFAHYKRVVYLSQNPNDDLLAKARLAADKLGLELVHKHVGYGALERTVKTGK